jgi:hypothetical protein
MKNMTIPMTERMRNMAILKDTGLSSSTLAAKSATDWLG